MTLEILDRSTHEAIERLIAAGVLASKSRAVRPLVPDAVQAGAVSLTDAERARITALHETAARKLKAAKALGDAGLEEEARLPLLEAMHLRACALAVSRRIAEPENLADAFRQPLLGHFGPGFPVLRAFVLEESNAWRPAADALLAATE